MTDEEVPGEQPRERPGEPAGEPAVNADAKPARGKKRMKQLAKSNEEVRLQLEADILAEIGGGTPTVLHRVAAESMASAIIAGRKLRAKGQSDADAIRQIAQIARAFGLKPAPNAPSAPLTIQDQLRLRGYTPPTASPAADTTTDDMDDE